jgi:Carboxyl transferase domain
MNSASLAIGAAKTHRLWTSRRDVHGTPSIDTRCRCRFGSKRRSARSLRGGVEYQGRGKHENSIIDVSSTDFARNSEVMRSLVAELRDKLNLVSGGGGKTSRARHTARGKMLARERVDLLVDPGTAFLKLSPLAAHGLYGGDVHLASVITGVGRISGRECFVVANDATIKGGTYYPMTVKKHLRAQDIARQNICPASTWWSPAARFCRCRTRSFRTNATSTASSITRRRCRRSAFPRSRS